MNGEPATYTLLEGDALEKLRWLADDSVHCVVTSPPYWGLRDYKTAGQIGLEKTPELWVARLVEVFREVRRVLHPSGTLWLNVGDSYSSGDRATWRSGVSDNKGQQVLDDMPRPKTPPGMKAKDLIGLPWMLAFALRADGWYLRQDIVWAKPSCMPESVTDRCTKSHEYIFLLTKEPQYFYDMEAIKEPTGGTHPRREGANSRMSVERQPGKENSKPNPSRYSRIPSGWDTGPGNHHGNEGRYEHQQPKLPGVTPKSAPAGSGTKANESFHAACVSNRNKRSVWTIASEPYPGAHFATFPTELPKLCILAGTSARGVCPSCLAPWERILEDGQPDLAHQQACGGDGNGDYFGKATKDYSSANAQDPAATKARILRGMVEKKTIGWKPTCDCSEPPIPATVLDPFAGSFTTCAVALELGRSAIGIELNPDYIAQGQERLAKVTPGLKLF
jgi:DNA modification methylase